MHGEMPLGREHRADSKAAILFHRSARGRNELRVFRNELNIDLREGNLRTICCAFEFDGSMDIDSMLQRDRNVDRLVFHFDALNGANAIFRTERDCQQYVRPWKY